ncbi:hypothetical protein OHA72_22335 [Dactylosporangium sp. NBC_01737]|uniref:hypothetical protein n=1 Tax=Dactylosporangium sp. NBC_01737 TaxID=2975959 RepID=UPI002E14CE04|nr:hypothetical protein OHA72_22335 [Dactylosporangium sp. NBC_01737]
MQDDGRFGPDFVAAHLAAHGKRMPEQRQLTYDIAVEPAFAHWRRWYGEQLALLPQAQGDALAGRLWLDEHFWPVTFELAAGAVIRSAGYTALYEHDHDGLTPDWTALTSSGELAFLLEVHTDQPTKETFGQIRGWKGLERRIAQIPVGVVLKLQGPRHVALRPPDGGTAKKVARELRSRLLGSPHTTRIHTHGYTFVVLANMFGPLKSANGLFAQFAAPSGVAGPVNASRLVLAVDEKVSKYAARANGNHVPLVVAVGSHRFTSVDLDDLDALLDGSPTMNFHFNVGDSFIGTKSVNPASPARWTMPTNLAGLLWLHNQPPFGATARPNSNGHQLMPPPLAQMTQTPPPARSVA